jgi:uncharacterized protein YecE (DUF72 family)
MGHATRVWVGVAGWSIPRALASRFDSTGTHLQRYARRLPCAEINSSFYRPHAVATYARWRASTPPHFRFAVKMPRAITHELKLENAREPLVAFLGQTDGLGEKRGPILVQTPPSLSFDARVAPKFLRLLREVHDGPVACEPRHATWFEPRVVALLDRLRIAMVAADPPPAPAAASPAGWPGLVYYRLHGSPRTYWSRYEEAFIAALSCTLPEMAASADVWCVFDNTAMGTALDNACDLQERLNVDPAE